MPCNRNSGYPAEKDLVCSKCKKPIKKGAHIHSFLDFASFGPVKNVCSKCMKCGG